MSLGQFFVLFLVLFLLGPCSSDKKGLDLLTEDSQEEEEEILERVPVFTTSISTKLVNQGDQIRLPCFVDKLEGFVLLWKRGETIISVDKRVISSSGNRTKILSDKNGNWLMIESSKVEDEGIYTCQFSAVQPREIGHRVLIRTRPEIHAVQDHVAVKEGDTVQMSCYIKSGYPLPEITWTKSSQGDPASSVPLGSGPELILKNVSHTMAGMYRCTADNGFPVYSTDIVNVVVLHKPYIKNEDGFVHSNVDGENTTSLTCTVSAYPKAKVSWSYLDHTGKAHSLQDSQTHEVGSAHVISLMAPNARLGEYKCRAVNEYGAHEAIIELSNLVGPIRLESHRVGNETKMYNLTWTGESIDTVTKFNLNIYKDNHELITTSVIPSSRTGNIWMGWYIISELEENYIYTATVSGTNSHGKGPEFGPWKFGPEKIESSSDLTTSHPVVLFNVLLISIFLFK